MRTTTRKRRPFRDMRSENDPGFERRAGRRPPRTSRRWLIGGALLLVLVGAAPMIVAYTPLRNSVLASVCGELNGTVTAGSASLGWFSPVVLHDVEVRDTQGNLMLQAETIQGNTSLLTLLTQSASLGSFEVQNPRLHVVFTDGGSNVESLLANFLNQSSSERPPRVTVRVVDGEIHVDDPLSQSRWKIGDLTANASIGSDDTAPLRAIASGQLVQPDRVSQFNLDLETMLAPPLGQLSNGELNIESANFPLFALQPLLRRARAGTQVAGWLSGNAHFSWGDEKGQLLASLTGDLRAEQLAVRDPALGGDILRLEKLSLPCQLTARGGRVLLHEFNAFSEVGDLQFGGRLEMPLAEGWSAVLESLRSHEYELIARLDLARLAGILPRTLRIRPGTQIESGNVNAHLSHKIGSEGATWNLLAVSSNLAGFNAGQKIVWDRPIRVELTARETQQGPVVDLLRCESEFLTLDAEGTLQSFAVAAEHNLDRLAVELGRFVDLGAVRLGGTGWSYLSWDRRANGAFDGQYECQIRDFEFTLPGRPAWREPTVLALLKATGAIDEDFRLRAVQTASLQVESGSERAKVTLLEAVPQVQSQSRWPLRLDVEGGLPQLLARAEPILGRFPDGEIRGQLRLSATGDASGEQIAVRQSRAVVQDLNIRRGNWNIAEPQVQAVVEGIWHQPTRRGEITLMSLTGSTITADTRRAALHLPVQGVPQFAGDIAFAGDLGRLRSWHPSIAALELAGNVNGTAKVSQVGAHSMWDVAAQWKNASLVSPNWRWSEPSLSVATRADYDELRDAMQIEQLHIDSRSLRLAGAGVIDNLKTRPSLEMTGNLDYDYQNLLPLLKSYMGEGVTIALTRRSRPFQVSGPLAPPAPPQGVSAVAASNAKEWLSEWTAITSLDWTSLEAYGFRAGAGEAQPYLHQGVAGLKPLDLAVNNGRLTAAPRFILVGERPEFRLDPGLLLDRVEVTEEMCGRGLKYVAPLLASATRPQGRFSLDTTGCRMPLGDALQAEMAGRLMVHDITVTPGPLLHLIAGSINAVRLASGKTSGFTRTDVARLKRESVIAYRLVEGRVYHQNLELDFDDVTVSTRGSVGLDQTLAIVAHVRAPRLFAQVPALAGLQTQGLELPIHGTLNQPKLDRSHLQSQAVMGILSDDNLRRAGGEAVQNLLNRGMKEATQELQGEKLFQNFDQGLKRLFGPK